MGQFLGFSDEHSSLVTNVQHLSTGYIYPPFCLLFDDLFETVIIQGDDGSTYEAICGNIFYINRYRYIKEKFEDDGNIIYRPPPLHNVFLDEQGCCDRKQELERQRM